MKKKINKSAFVRAQGNIPAKEVVARAKKAGLTFSEKYVHTIRYNAKKKGNAKKAGRHANVVRASLRAKTVTAHLGNAQRVEEMLKSIASFIGIPRAIEVLQTERDRTRKLIEQ